MTVIHSCQVHLYCTSLVFHIWLRGPLYLLNLNVLNRFIRLQTTNWEKFHQNRKSLQKIIHVLKAFSVLMKLLSLSQFYAP